MKHPIPLWVLCLLAACGGGGAATPAAAPSPAPAPSPSPTPPPAPAPSNRWTLVWSDEFDGPAGAAPNPSHWSYDLGNRESGGWGNNELQYYTDSRRNSQLDGNGVLLIRAERQAQAGPCWNGTMCEFTSARLLSRGKVAVRYGKVEARIQVPGGKGIWPAFWSLGDGRWPDVGEIDIMEFVGKEPNAVYGTVHGPGYSGANGLGKERRMGQPVPDAFHVFAIVKRPNEIEWFLDGESFFKITPASLPAGAAWVFERDYFLIMNLAVGGHWPGSPDASTPFPATMKVDYVRIYKED
ncbi:family 16 glycosylhydrolase [Inhella sp.]|uniref:glycoside hydrolase family 16 protein n=1 Tax=Inhella sp. TaxID=1921806 RepID=UPI0035AFF6ED